MAVAEPVRIPINELTLVPELSPRARLCEETVIRYMESYESLPPVRVQRGSRTVIDGYHRVEAATRLGMEMIAALEEAVEDDELRLLAGLANVEHGQPLTRGERNQLAVALVRNYGKLREEAARLLGISASAVTLALREHQFNEQLSEKLGGPVQVINSAHVRALYRVGPEQRERLLEAVVSKVDEDGRPYPLTGAELKLLVDRMLDPATPTAELNRLLSDPRARPTVAGGVGSGNSGASAARDENDDGFVPEAPSGDRPWEREGKWESPLKGGDTEAFGGVRAVDKEIEAAGGGVDREGQIGELLRRAEDNAHERGRLPDNPFWGQADAPGPDPNQDPEVRRLREGVDAARRALKGLISQVQPESVRGQVEAVVAVLETLR
jgi:hypothetical protein